MTHASQPTRVIYFFGAGQADAGSDIKHLVGGKGASLADMTNAGLNVPPGFTISAECCELYYRADRTWPAGLEEEVRSHLRRLEELVGRPFGVGADPLLVAVRSGAAQSMPGMMDTILNVGLNAKDPWACLHQAISDVFDSWNSERAVTYRRHHQIDGLLGTAVTVQAMCPAEVAGVIFTANPVNPDLQQIVVESSFGLGEAVVLGKVTPDRFVIIKHTLEISERTISQNVASLNDEQLVELARLGLRVEQHFKTPCDIEWALSRGEFFLLQARPIRARSVSDGTNDSSLDPSLTLRALKLEQVRHEEIAALRAKAAPEGTVWSRYNLSEILPAPTPMTWSIVRRFLSGQGGFGQMYRDLGFTPDPSLDDDGIYDLVCNRPYCNLSREPKMQYARLPYEHPFGLLKAEPRRALYPQAVPTLARATWRFWLSLPWLFLKEFRTTLRLRKLSRTFLERYVSEIVPALVQEVERDAADDFFALDTESLLQRLRTWIKRTLCDFARESLKPTVFAALARGNLERALARLFGRGGAGKARDAVAQLIMGVRSDPETDLAGAIRGLATQRYGRKSFLKSFGHRGEQEMELSQPRWCENPAALDRLLSTTSALGEPPEMIEAVDWEKILPGVKLSSNQRATLEEELGRLRLYLGLRENAKHYFMLGYGRIRAILLKLDQRFQLDGGVFFLTLEELPALVQSKTVPREVHERIAERRRRRELALSLPVPPVLFSDDLEAIGRTVELSSTETLQGVPLSLGVAEGLALVLTEPNAAELPAEPFILVCPSTDPAWVPLFVRALGLVMETGGVLSHGAIVAREFGLPAVAGLPDVQRRLRTGQRLRIDGGTGTVNILS